MLPFTAVRILLHMHAPRFPHPRIPLRALRLCCCAPRAHSVQSCPFTYFPLFATYLNAATTVFKLHSILSFTYRSTASFSFVQLSVDTFSKFTDDIAVIQARRQHRPFFRLSINCMYENTVTIRATSLLHFAYPPAV